MAAEFAYEPNAWFLCPQCAAWHHRRCTCTPEDRLAGIYCPCFDVDLCDDCWQAYCDTQG
jgi:hypothetical protein